MNNDTNIYDSTEPTKFENAEYSYTTINENANCATETENHYEMEDVNDYLVPTTTFLKRTEVSSVPEDIDVYSTVDTIQGSKQVPKKPVLLKESNESTTLLSVNPSLPTSTSNGQHSQLGSIRTSQLPLISSDEEGQGEGPDACSDIYSVVDN